MGAGDTADSEHGRYVRKKTQWQSVLFDASSSESIWTPTQTPTGWLIHSQIRSCTKSITCCLEWMAADSCAWAAIIKEKWMERGTWGEMEGQTKEQRGYKGWQQQRPKGRKIVGERDRKMEWILRQLESKEGLAFFVYILWGVIAVLSFVWF